MALAACSGTTDPNPGAGLAEHLVGNWDLVAVNDQPIPGWVRGPAFLVDSSYIAAGRLTFQRGSLCSRTRTTDADQPPAERRCTYGVTDNEAWLRFENDQNFTITAHTRSDRLTLWGPPCDLWAVICSRHREDYRKSSP